MEIAKADFALRESGGGEAVWRKLRNAFDGEAERVGWSGEDDVIAYCREIRREMSEERRGRAD